MRWVMRLLTAAVVLAAGMGQAQQTAPRYALVIGNAAYQTPGWQLVNPVNDANLMVTRLRGLGFQVTPLMNASKSQMEAAMNAFTARVSAGGTEAVGVFYYAGHGVEHDGANLLVPVDVNARSMDELRYQAPPMQFLLRDMARAGNKVNVIILDACRNLPLPAGSRSGPAGGLAEIEDVPDNVLIAYATRPGLTAPDNPNEGNSVFTRTLSEALASNPSDTVVNLFSQVQARVFSSTGRAQRPEFRSGLLRAPDWRFVATSGFATPAIDPALQRRAEEAERRAAALEEQLRRPPPASQAPFSTPTVAAPVLAAEARDALLTLDEQRIASFLQRGWNPNTPLDAQGNAALHILMEVCEKEHVAHDRNRLARLAKRLLDAGAERTRANRWGDTPLSIARAPRYCGASHPVIAVLN